MDMTLFGTREQLLALKRLWLANMFAMSDDNSGQFRMDINGESVRTFPIYDQLMYAEATASSANYASNMANAQAMALGPKVFMPTAEQCEAMGEVRIEIGPGEVRLPYDNVVIFFPEQYRARLREDYQEHKRIPTAAMVARLPLGAADGSMPKDLFTVCVHLAYHDQVENGGIVLTMRSRSDKSVESLLTSPVHMDGKPEEPAAWDKDWDVTIRAQRVALNLAMLLAQGPTQLSALDPKAREKHLHHSKSGAKEKRERARVFLQTSFDRVVPEQDIVFYTDEAGKAYYGKSGERAPAGAGHSPRAHWRKGHWRRLDASRGHFKASRSVFVRPVFVRGKSIPAVPGHDPVEVTYRSPEQEGGQP